MVSRKIRKPVKAARYLDCPAFPETIAWSSVPMTTIEPGPMSADAVTSIAELRAFFLLASGKVRGFRFKDRHG